MRLTIDIRPDLVALMAAEIAVGERAVSSAAITGATAKLRSPACASRTNTSRPK